MPGANGSFMEIPVPLWTAFGAAAFSLLMVVVTNLFNDRRLRKQFKYERELRNDDNAAALRKEIYLAAAEAIQAGITSIAKLGNLDVPYNEVVKDYVKKAPAIAKVQIIANESVLRAVTDVMDELGALHLKGAAERISLETMQKHSTQQGEHISTLAEQRDQLLTLMQQYDPAESGGMERFEELSKRFEETQDRIQEMLAAKSKTDRDLYSGVATLVEKCIAELSRLTKLAIPAVVAIRAELSLPIDEGALFGSPP